MFDCLLFGMVSVSKLLVKKNGTAKFLIIFEQLFLQIDSLDFVYCKISKTGLLLLFLIRKVTLETTQFK